jgi:hypothetical protein
MKRHYLTGGIYVEAPADHTVVSWPGGHRVLDADATLTDLLDVLTIAFKDVMAERPTHRPTHDAKRTAYNKGYDAGWADAKKHVRVV